MSLYAIGDLHLHYQSVLKAEGQLTGAAWRGHEERFRENCARTVRESDTLVLVGDHSWGKDLAHCEKDLEYIAALPGRKVLIRGNHDMFWDAGKTGRLNELYKGKLLFLQNSYVPYGNTAIVGTKGYTFEGPFRADRRGRVVDWDRQEEAHARALVERESERLRLSFEAAARDGYSRFVMFLHYPPTNILETDSPFTRMAEEYGVREVVYAHCHGQARFHDSLRGTHRGVLYTLVSGDSLLWQPYRVGI